MTSELLLSRLKQTNYSWIRDLVSNTPLIAGLYRYFWAWRRKVSACRGIFRTFEAASASAPRNAKVGYSQQEVRRHKNPALLTARRNLGEFQPRDYPILIWLAHAFRQSNTLFDLGGNVGLEYYAYSRFMRYPEGLKWTVCEIDEICEVGQKLARENKAIGLQFTNDFQHADGAEILLSCGAIQYLQKDLSEMIASLPLAPRHVLVNRVPLGDVPTFFTIQNIGYAFCAYKIQNREDFINSLTLLGYKLIDQWRDARYCHIPFHPGLTVKGYSGFYFRR